MCAQFVRMNDSATGVWRAEVLEPGTREGERRLAELQEQGRVREMFDTLENQLAELVISREPALKQDPAGVLAAVKRELAGRSWEEFGLWVYYPWRGVLVRLLPEGLFAELRTNRNNNRITPEEQRRLARTRVGVVGLSVGASFALTLAMERAVGTLCLADFDDIELSNLNRIRTPLTSLGLPKWLVTAREISEIDPFLRVEVFPEGLKSHNVNAFFEGLDLVCDACDDLATKATIRLQARARQLPVVMDTSDRGMLDIERYDWPDQIPNGYLHGRIDEQMMLLFAGSNRWTPDALDAFVDLSAISSRGRASLAEVGRTLVAWPQLYGEVAAGGATAAQAARRILLGETIPDSRIYLDLDEQLAESLH